MRKQYDFARMKGRRNPYAPRLKRSVTIRLDDASITYFKELAAETGIAYQSLINLYLRECVVHRRRPAERWVSEDEARAESESDAAEFVVSDRPSGRASRRGSQD
jgi:antitoxin component of RelBE/YafQ-DinJ toxin-antitoxin module